jgi:hypothetical protein
VNRLFGTVFLAVDGAPYHWEDVLLAGELWGEWGEVRQRVRQGLACLERAQDDEDGLAEEQVEAAANEFRYQRDLETAQQTEEWLERWGLDVEGWMDYIRWSLLRRKWAHQLPALVSAHPVDDDAIESLVETEAVCSGDVARLARELAGRAAVHQKEQEEPVPEAEDPPAETARVVDILSSGPRQIARSQLDAEILRAKVERLARIEASFQRFRRRALTAQAVQAWIRVRQADWTRVDCSYLSLPREDMAREAALAVRADGRQLVEVAGDAGTSLRRGRFFMDELDPSVRGLFWSARPGELVGPLQDDGGFSIYLVLDKTEPSVADGEIVTRAEETLLRRLIDREIDGRVKWHVSI